MLEALRVRTLRAIEEKVFPGCVIGVLHKSAEPDFITLGSYTYEDSPVAEADTVYDVASITKSIPTTSLALICIGDGKMKLADRVREYLPELRNDYGATVQDLLLYTVTGPRLSTLRSMTADDMQAYIFSSGFDGPPAEQRYTNLPAFLLGLILERVGGARLEILAQRAFFDPLKMDHSTFLPDRNRATYRSIAPTEIDETGEVCGIVHDESARVFARAGRAVGHAGLFSTAPDILKFFGALLAGEFPQVVEGARAGLGWPVGAAFFMGAHAASSTFGKTGFTGTSCMCDTDGGVAFVVLSNRTYPRRPSDDMAIHAFRADIADIIFGSLR